MKKLLITESQFKLITEGGYKRYHINMNVPLPSSGRRAARISPSEFKDKMKKIYDDYNSSNGDDKKFTVGGFVNTFCHYWSNDKPSCLETMNDDLSKIEHDGENCDSIGDIESSNGLTYVKGRFGGDWEIPVLFFIYWDGHKFRGYIPTKGNTFNRKEKIALGNREDDDEYVRKECGDDNATANRVTYDVKSCLADFKARVKVK